MSTAREYLLAKDCANCGTEFTPRTRTHVYCSDVCQRRAGRHTKRKTPLAEIKCPCGTVFRPVAVTQRFCCRKCQRREENRLARERRMEGGIGMLCGVCEEWFEARHHKVRYCSALCSWEADRRRQVGYRRERSRESGIRTLGTVPAGYRMSEQAIDALYRGARYGR